MTAAGVQQGQGRNDDWLCDFCSRRRRRDQRFYNLNSWESLWRRPLYYYYKHKRSGENIVITNKCLSGARASVRLLSGPFDTRPDYLQVCVRFGFLRLYAHYYNIIYYYDGPAGGECSHPVAPQCCMCVCAVRIKVFADNPIKCRPCKVYYTISKHIHLMRTWRAFKKKNRIMLGRERETHFAIVVPHCAHLYTCNENAPDCVT